MENSNQTLLQIYRSHQQQSIEEYLTFLRFPSISSISSHRSDVEACAQWLSTYLQKLGLQVEIWSTPGHPVVFASYTHKEKNKPTILLYNHYDVQPIDPIEEWKHPPFEPYICGLDVFARGAQDNKGQCFYVLQAIKTLLERDKELPCNVKLVIEGEEEMGSVGFSSLLPQKKDKLQADYLAVVDLGLKEKNRPAITLGVRGIITMDIKVEGATHDLHSGSNGGINYNAVQALVEMLASIKDAKGKINIPHFYDDVESPSVDDMEKISFHFDEESYQREVGYPAVGGEVEDYPPSMRATIRPTFEINGISGGYFGDGFKTVIGAKACAKVSCRLVPNQNPEKIAQLVKNFLVTHAPHGVKVDVEIHEGSGKPIRVSQNSAVAKAFQKAYSEIFDKPCEAILSGGSIPVISSLVDAIGAEVVFLGLGLSTDLIHAPNENFSLDRIEKGMLIIARGLEILAQEEAT